MVERRVGRNAAEERPAVEGERDPLEGREESADKDILQ